MSDNENNGNGNGQKDLSGGNGNECDGGNGNGGNGFNREKGRDAMGRFIAGCPGGPGRGMSEAAEKMRRALIAACSTAEVNAVARVLIKHARAGHSWAVTELLNRLFGKPRQQVDISGLPEPIKHLAGIVDEEV